MDETEPGKCRKKTGPQMEPGEYIESVSQTQDHQLPSFFFCPGASADFPLPSELPSSLVYSADSS